MPATKSLMSGTWASTLLAGMRSAWPEEATISRAARAPKKTVSEGTPRASTRLGDVASRLDAEHADAARDEVLEQVAVVARRLDDEVLRAEPEVLDHRVRVVTRVLDPAVRVRGEVGVLREDRLGRDELGELHEQ